MVIVTKVPLCGYYFPDGDEIVWPVCHPVLFTWFVHSVKDDRVPNSGVILAATSGKKYLLAHTFVLKLGVLGQAELNKLVLNTALPVIFARNSDFSLSGITTHSRYAGDKCIFDRYSGVNCRRGGR